MSADKNPYENPKDRLGTNKIPLHLIPSAAKIHEAFAMWCGAVSYGPFNWRDKRVIASVYIAAGMRHREDWWDGDDMAKDGGHHLGHSRCCDGIILDAEANGMLIDDRPTKGASRKLMTAYEALIKTIKPMLTFDPETGLADRGAVDWTAAHEAYYAALKAEEGRDLAPLVRS